MVLFLFFAQTGQTFLSSASGNIVRTLLGCGAPYPVSKRRRHAAFWQFILTQRPRERVEPVGSFEPDLTSGYQQEAGMTDSLQISVDGDKEVAVMSLRGHLSIQTSPD